MTARRAARRGAAFLSAVIVAGLLMGCVASDTAPDATVVASGAAGEIRRSSGDDDLVARLGSTFSEDFERAAVAVIGDDVRTAFVDADESTAWEIGSITKVLTGELLAVAIERGEVSPDDALGEYLDLGDAPAASATLVQLATHRSGLPDWSSDPEWLAEFDRAYAARENPLGDDLDGLLDLARGATLDPAREFQYSSLGVSLLGHALASAAGIDYPELLRQRVLVPLGMEHAVLVERPDQVPDAQPQGFDVRGEPVAPWVAGAFSPSGGVTATLGDLVALAGAVLDGDLAHSPSLEPIAEVNGHLRIGYLWFVEDYPARTITAHTGQSGSFGTALVIDRASGVAAIVMTNTESDQYDLALRLLVDAEG